MRNKSVLAINNFVICCFFLFAPVFVSCSCCGVRAMGTNSDSGSKEAVVLELPVDDFNRVLIDVPAYISYETGDSKCVIEGSGESIKHILYKYDDGKLRIYSDNNSYKNFKRISITANSKSLGFVRINGAAEFECCDGFSTDSFSFEGNGAVSISINKLEADKVDIKVNGSGDIDFNDIAAGSVNVRLNGAGKADLSGKVEAVDAKINGAGSIDVSRLEYSNIIAETNGVGRIRR